MVSLSDRRRNPLVIIAVLLFFFLALDSLVGDSPTMDEQNHIARGLAFLHTGDPRLSLEHPPLVNTLSALPLLTLPAIRLPTDHPSWQIPQGWYEFADLLLWSYNHDVTRMVFLARLPILFLTLGLALVGYHFARELWGATAALITFWLLLFEPNILAHGRYSTTDVGGTTFILLATWLLWRLWQSGRWAWGRWLAVAVAMGLAFGSKLSALSFVPIWSVLALLPLYGHSTSTPQTIRELYLPALRRLLQLGSAGLVSLLVLWAIFGFQWGPLRFQAASLQALNGVRGPMPTFWAGVEQIAGLSSSGRSSAFLLGRFSDTGFLAYFPVAFLTKTPLPILILLPAAIVLLLYTKTTRPHATFLLTAAACYFLLSLQSALNIGYRHLLPMLPFLLILLSGLANVPVIRSGWDRFHVSRFTFHASQAALLVTLLALLLSDFLIHPHYLSYFNQAAGGPANGYRILVDSNVDWGQDLLRLKQWMAAHDVEEVKLAWFGTADPDYYGIKNQPLPGLGRHKYYSLWGDPPLNSEAPEPGVYAISVTNLWELPRPVSQKYVFPWFRAHPPDDRVGYSILIYVVP